MVSSLPKTRQIQNTQTVQKKQKKSKNKGFQRSYLTYAAASIPTSIISGEVISAMKKASQLSAEDSVMLTDAIKKGLESSGLKAKGVEVFKMHQDKSFDAALKDAFKSVVGVYRRFFSGDYIGIDDEGKNLFKNLRKIMETDERDLDAINALKTEFMQNKKIRKRLGRMNLNLEAARNYNPELPADAAEMMAKALGLIFKTGNNACYLGKANKIIIPSKDLRTSVFHEMGHALNNNGGMFLKTLQKARLLGKTIPAYVLLISLLNKKPKNSEKADTTTLKGKIQYAADTVKNNAGLIAGLSIAPTVLEEGIASLRGQGIAKNLVKNGSLSKEIFKKVKLTNLGGFSSYALSLIGTVFAIETAIKVKDNIQNKFEAKKIAKEEQKLQKAMQQ